MSEAFTLIKSCCIEALYDQAWSLAPEINLLQRSQIRHYSLWYIKRVKNLIENSTFKKQRSLNLIPSFHGKQMRKKVETVENFIFLGSKITAMVTAAMKLKDNLLGIKTMANIDSVFKSRDINITHYQRNANQNHHEVSFHTSQNGHDQKSYKQ